MNESDDTVSESTEKPDELRARVCERDLGVAFEVVYPRTEHRALILDSWAASARRAPRYQRLGPGGYTAARHGFARRLDTGTTLVALDTTALGWICGRRDERTGRLRVHYCYVLSAFRRQGVASRLVRELAVACDATLPGVYDLKMPPYTRGLDAHGWTLRREVGC
jgi:GNAT superfamily N-acetyltransferase